jgi:hypothetical protein
MTTASSYNTLPPMPTPEDYLGHEELKPGSLYLLDSDLIEPIGYCVDGQYFLGLHIEERGELFCLRIAREYHQSFGDKNGISCGTKPKAEVAQLYPIDLSGEGRNANLAVLLVHQLRQHYSELLSDTSLHPYDKEDVDVKQRIFSDIVSAWELGTLGTPDEHGLLDITSIRQD